MWFTRYFWVKVCAANLGSISFCKTLAQCWVCGWCNRCHGEKTGKKDSVFDVGGKTPENYSKGKPTPFSEGTENQSVGFKPGPKRLKARQDRIPPIVANYNMLSKYKPILSFIDA